MKVHEAVKLVEASSLFDAKWYVDRYPDVKAANMNPAAHYCKYGWRMLRDPSSQFSTVDYLTRHKDVKKKGLNPLFHYLCYGEKEGRIVSSSQPTVVLNKSTVPPVPVEKEKSSSIVDLNAERISKQLEKTQALLEHYFNRCKELEYSLPNQKIKRTSETK